MQRLIRSLLWNGKICSQSEGEDGYQLSKRNKFKKKPVQIKLLWNRRQPYLSPYFNYSFFPSQRFRPFYNLFTRFIKSNFASQIVKDLSALKFLTTQTLLQFREHVTCKWFKIKIIDKAGSFSKSLSLRSHRRFFIWNMNLTLFFCQLFLHLVFWIRNLNLCTFRNIILRKGLYFEIDVDEIRGAIRDFILFSVILFQMN